MNKNKTNNKANGKAARKPQAKPVHLEFTHPTAVHVHVAGSFNEWRPEVSPMIPVGAGRWAKELALPPGAHEYCLVVDGDWRPDPQARETVPNPFGGLNSVLRVAVPN